MVHRGFFEESENRVRSEAASGDPENGGKGERRKDGSIHGEGRGSGEAARGAAGGQVMKYRSK